MLVPQHEFMSVAVAGALTHGMYFYGNNNRYLKTRGVSTRCSSTADGAGKAQFVSNNGFSPSTNMTHAVSITDADDLCFVTLISAHAIHS